MTKPIINRFPAAAPLQRHQSLIPISKDHHFVLLLCWKIRTGRQRKISNERILAYVRHFYATNLVSHLQIEETYVFTKLPEEDPRRIEACRQHDRLRELFGDISIEALSSIETELEAHIRFEERVLFPHIQTNCNEDQLFDLKTAIEQVHVPFADVWEDPFWA